MPLSFSPKGLSVASCFLVAAVTLSVAVTAVPPADSICAFAAST